MVAHKSADRVAGSFGERDFLLVPMTEPDHACCVKQDTSILGCFLTCSSHNATARSKSAGSFIGRPNGNHIFRKFAGNSGAIWAV